MPITRLNLNVDDDGEELVSISQAQGGVAVFAIDLGGYEPGDWGMMLSDLLRQAAVCFEAEGVSLNGRMLSAAKIEGLIKDTLDSELLEPWRLDGDRKSVLSHVLRPRGPALRLVSDDEPDDGDPAKGTD